MELYLTVFYGNHILSHQSQIFYRYIKKFWHDLSVHNITYDSLRQRPPGGNTIEICVKIKKNYIDIIMKKKNFKKFVTCDSPRQGPPGGNPFHGPDCILKINFKHHLKVWACPKCTQWYRIQPPAGLAGKQCYLK
jgi:hypothetical protein